MIDIILFVFTSEFCRSKSHFYYILYVHRIEIIFFVFASELWRIFCLHIISTYDWREPRDQGNSPQKLAL